MKEVHVILKSTAQPYTHDSNIDDFCANEDKDWRWTMLYGLSVARYFTESYFTENYDNEER